MSSTLILTDTHLFHRKECESHAGEKDHSDEIYLTFIGGGVFGNRKEWIGNAIGRAIAVTEERIRGKLPKDLKVIFCQCIF